MLQSRLSMQRSSWRSSSTSNVFAPVDTGGGSTRRLQPWNVAATPSAAVAIAEREDEYLMLRENSARGQSKVTAKSVKRSNSNIDASAIKRKPAPPRKPVSGSASVEDIGATVTRRRARSAAAGAAPGAPALLDKRPPQSKPPPKK